jgi:hypothetical protein
MTKWICNGCTAKCKSDVRDIWYIPSRCLLFKKDPCWKRDCTTEERSSAVFDAFAGVDNRVCHLEKKVQDLITAGQGQMARIQALEKKVQELEQMFRDHTHYISGTTGKSAWREK